MAIHCVSPGSRIRQPPSGSISTVKFDMIRRSKLVVIIILNVNKKDEVLECLESVYQLDYPNYEVVVVDNGSTDGSIDAISNTFPHAHLIRHAYNAGVAGGRNLGVNYANRNFSYDYLYFLDNDTRVDKESLSQLTRMIGKDGQIGIGTPKSYRTSQPGIIASAGGINVNLYTGSMRDIGAGEVDRAQYERPKLVNSCAGFAFLVKKEVLLRVGSFDNDFNPYGWEDVDFCLRARKSGFKILYVPKALVFHKGGRFGRGQALPEYERHKVTNFFKLMKRHTNPVQKMCFWCSTPLRALFFLTKGLCSGDGKIVLAQCRGLFRGLLGSGKR